MSSIILSDKIYIPIKLIDTNLAEKLFTKEIFKKEAICQRCPFLEDRVSESCFQCQNYGGTYKLYCYTDINRIEYIGLPIGAQKKVREFFTAIINNATIDDQRPKTSFKYPIKFTGTLYDTQIEPVDIMIKKKYGILQAVARFGKTTVATAMICAIGKKSLILTSQSDWLEQFYETFIGSDNNKACTNIKEIEEQEGNKICGICKTEKDFRDFDICLATYQTFISLKGQQLLNKIKSLFPVVIVDEVQAASSTHFAKILNKISATHKYGLSATPTRKDMRHVLAENIIGPVQHIVKIETLIPKVEFTKSNFDGNYKTYNGLVTALSRDKERNKLIIEICEYYYKLKHSIVIPLLRTEHVLYLVEKINKLAGKEIAAAFTGQMNKVDRRNVIIKTRNKQIRILIGIRSIISTGINIPVLSMILECMPISNHEKLIQETSRILTVYKDSNGNNLKPDPIIHYIIDDAGSLSTACLKNCILNTHKVLKHHISKAHWDLLKPYLKSSYSSTRYANDDIDNKTTSNIITKTSTLRLKGLFSKDIK